MPLTKIKKDVIQNLDATKLYGTFGAIDGGQLTGLSVVDNILRYNLALNFLNDSVRDNMDRLSLHQGWVDSFEDASDVEGGIESTENACTTMTSSSGPSGTPSASDNHSPASFSPNFQAFDGNKSTSNRGWATNTAGTHHIQYSFNNGLSAQVITSYQITSVTGEETRAPKNWTLQASNTGSFGGEEVTLDTQTDITWTSNQETKKWNFTNDTAYVHYRIALTANNGGSYYQLAEVEFHKKVDSKALFNVPMTKFDGANDYLTDSTGMIPDGKKFTFSALIDLNDDSVGVVFVNTSYRFHIGKFANGTIQVLVRAPGSSGGFGELGSITTADTLTVADGPTMLTVAVNLETLTMQVRIGTAAVSSHTVSQTITDGTIDMAGALFSIGAAGHNATPSDYLNADIGRLWLTDEYMDISDAATFAKLVTSAGLPADVGANGSTPTGTQPRIFLNNQADTFQNNLGSGGNFTEAGQLVDGGYLDTPLTNALYSSESFSNHYELLDFNGKERGLYNSNFGQTGGTKAFAQVLTTTETWSVTRIAISMRSKTSTVPADLVVPFISGVDTTAGDVGGPGGLGTGADGDDNIIALGTGRSFNSSNISSTVYAVQYFDFPEPVTLPAGSYAFGLKTLMNESTNYLRGHVGDPQHHSGNSAQRNDTAWVGNNSHDYDFVFYIYGSKNLDLITKGSDDIGNSPATAPATGHMEVLMTERPASATTELTRTLTTNSSSTDNGWRVVISNTELTNSAGKIRVTLQAATIPLASVFSNVSIVERAGTSSSGTTIPTEILFGGTSGVTIPVGSSITSDWTTFDLDASKDYLLIMDQPAATCSIRFALSGGHGYYVKSATNSFNVASYPSAGTLTYAADRGAIFTKLETEVQQVPNTDYIGQISRDGGTAWTDITLTRIKTQVGGTNNNLLAGNADLTSTSGTNLKGRIKTVNKDKITVQGISVNWS